MKLAIMQPYFFPYIGYFQCIAAVDKYILYENLDYITEGWMHRNRILTKNQAPSYINAKLTGKSSNKKISEIQLDKSPIWKKKLINSIMLNYRGSTFFDETFPLIERLIKSETDFLYKYNAVIIKGIANFLEIKADIVSNNESYLPLEKQLDTMETENCSNLQYLQLTAPIKKVARVIEICKNEKANLFINAIGGQDLYNKDEFKKYGINLFFIKSDEIVYKQFNEQYFSNLSIIDVLMHNGKEKTKEFLTQYTLI